MLGGTRISLHSADSPADSGPVRRRRTAVERQGLALRFVMIIGDRRLAEAQHVLCDQDTVVVDFPETSVRIGLCRLLPGSDGGIVLDCRVDYRPGAGVSRTAPAVSWERILTGRPGSLHQREALLREVVAARSRAPGRAVTRPALASLRYLAAAV